MTGASAAGGSSGCAADRGAEPLDLRLVLVAAWTWLVTRCCLSRPPHVTVSVAAAGLVVAACVAWFARRRRRAAGVSGPAVAPPGGAVLLVALGAALVLLPLAARQAHGRGSPLVALAAHRTAVTADLVVTDDPHRLSSRGIAGASRVAVPARAVALRTAAGRVATDGRVLVLGDADAWAGVLPGQRVRVDGRLQPSLDDPTAATLFARAAPDDLGRPPWWQRAAGTVRSALRRAAAGLPAGPRGLLPGLVVGDTSGLDPVLAEEFRTAGLTHLVAVSGTNLSILIGAVLLTLRRTGVRPPVAAAAGVLVLVAFVVVARPSPSVLRAAVMAAVALAAFASGRPRRGLPLLAAAVLALLLWDPALSADYGFALSVLATGALLLLAPGWAEALRRRRVPPGVAEAVAVAAAAHVVTAPVIAALSGRVSLVAIPANVLAEPVVAAATILGFLAALAAPVWLPAGALGAQLAGWPCRWLVWDAGFFGSLDGATVPWPAGAGGGLLLLALTVAVLAAATRPGPRVVLGVAATVATVIQIPVRSVASGWPPPGWVFVACDVGQGDALALRAGPGSAVVVDAGPDPVEVDRCLRDLHVSSVPLLAFTHFHLDHVGGLPGVLHGRSVARVVSSPLAEPASGVDLVREALAGRAGPVTAPPVGTVLQVGDVRLDVLGPAVPFRDTRSDPNNSSLVLRATVGGLRLLLPGDVEVEAQQAMVAAGLDLRADVLKVPHHGSAYSDRTFLAAVHARTAVISVGLHNDYGHPSPLLLGELARLGVPVHRTDRDGDVVAAVHGGRLAMVTHGVRAAAAGRADGGLGGPGGSTPPRGLSVADVRMTACPLVPSPSTTCPTSSPRCCCSSATRNCSSAGPSARSPPPPAAATPTWSRPSWPATSSRAPNCTSWSARRCSATPS